MAYRTVADIKGGVGVRRSLTTAISLTAVGEENGGEPRGDIHVGKI